MKTGRRDRAIYQQLTVCESSLGSSWGSVVFLCRHLACSYRHNRRPRRPNRGVGIVLNDGQKLSIRVTQQTHCNEKYQDTVDGASQGSTRVTSTSVNSTFQVSSTKHSIWETVRTELVTVDFLLDASLRWQKRNGGDLQGCGNTFFVLSFHFKFSQLNKDEQATEKKRGISK